MYKAVKWLLRKTLDAFNYIGNTIYDFVSNLFYTPPNLGVQSVHELSKDGDVTRETMLIACAAIAAKTRSVNFNPTVLEDEELKIFIDYIEKNKQQLREKNQTSFKFVFHETKLSHWLCGLVDITHDQTKILIVDSVGAQVFKARSSMANYLQELEDNNPHIKVILAEPKTQTDTNMCPIFALENVRKLFKLPALFWISNLEQLTPSMLRVTQSMKRINEYYERLLMQNLQDLPVNKRKLTFGLSVGKHTKEATIKQEVKLVNARIDDKQEKIRHKVVAFLNDGSVNHNSCCNAFTLRSFQRRALTSRI